MTDLGTEFGVEVSKEGITDSQVFSGSIKVLRVSEEGNNATEQIVRAG